MSFDWWWVELSGGDVNRDEGFSVCSDVGGGRKTGRYVGGDLREQ